MPIIRPALSTAVNPKEVLGDSSSHLTHPPLLSSILSNYVTLAWLGLLSMASIPFYVRLLGPQEWGLVAACMALQGVLSLLDVGFGQIMPRDFARVAGVRSSEYSLFLAYSRIYMALGVVGFCVAQLAAGFAAQRWFRTAPSDALRLEWALRLVAFQFLFQFANNAHFGYWYGLQHQVLANVRQIGFSTLRYTGALLAVFAVSRSVYSYIGVFALVSMLEFFLNRRSIHEGFRGVPLVRTPAVLRKQIHAIAREARGFAVGILVGVVVFQMDRLVLSATQDLARYGYYVIAANAAGAFLGLQAPLTRAYLPRMVRANAHTAGGDPSRLLRGLFAWLFLACVLPSLLCIAFAQSLLLAWLRRPEIVQAILVPFRLMLVGVILNAFYQVFYQQLFMAGSSRVLLLINLLCLAFAGVAAITFGPGLGITLGGVIWVIIGTTQAIFGFAWWWRRKGSLSRAAC